MKNYFVEARNGFLNLFMGKPVFKGDIDSSLESDLEVESIALVDKPAIEKNFMAFRDNRIKEDLLKKRQKELAETAEMILERIHKSKLQFSEVESTSKQLQFQLETRSKQNKLINQHLFEFTKALLEVQFGGDKVYRSIWRKEMIFHYEQIKAISEGKLPVEKEKKKGIEGFIERLSFQTKNQSY
jgi:hypothetical protein